MADVVLAASTRFRPTGAARNERGATTLEWVMIVALLLSAVVLVTAFGTSWTADVA